MVFIYRAEFLTYYTAASHKRPSIDRYRPAELQAVQLFCCNSWQLNCTLAFYVRAHTHTHTPTHRPTHTHTNVNTHLKGWKDDLHISTWCKRNTRQILHKHTHTFTHPKTLKQASTHTHTGKKLTQSHTHRESSKNRNLRVIVCIQDFSTLDPENTLTHTHNKHLHKHSHWHSHTHTHTHTHTHI